MKFCNFYKNKKLLILLLVLAIFLSIPHIYSQNITKLEVTKNQTQQILTKTLKPIEVKVGLYILNLGKFDIATGTFTADFYLSFKCDKKCPSDMDFEFINGRANSIDKIIDNPDEKFYRIQANLYSPIDLKKFPFDVQKMQIIIEDKRLTTDYLVYVPDLNQSGIDNSVTFIGWNYENYFVDVKEHSYDIYNESYSQYSFNIPIKRSLVNSVIKSLLPVFFIILVMLSSYVLDSDKILTRITMVGSSLVASVMFHVSLANQIPPVGYLTFMDKFMVLTYFIILLSFFYNVISLELYEKKKTELVNKIHKFLEYSVFIIVAVLYTLLFIFLL
ncbi:MAG: hypothetical protein QXW97_03620 [Candidatus Pacearchaeota archaeon]